MTASAARLAQLARLAELRSDAELKRFAAFRSHVESLSAQQAACRQRLQRLLDLQRAFSVEGSKATHAEAGRLAREIQRLEYELQRLEPNFTAARQRAMREFGRVRALETLAAVQEREARKKGSRQAGQ